MKIHNRPASTFSSITFVTLLSWDLQQNTNSVTSANWSNVTAAIQDDGTIKTLIVSPLTGNRFYRLQKP